CMMGAAALSLLYYDFVLDDAFISYRYADNLARYGTLAWNVGEAPVEGFSSLSWVVLNAAAIYLGADPMAVSRLMWKIEGRSSGLVVASGA
ncbi:MAG: hypothetical protein ACREAQ_09540, partial [Nitrososphaera sp.]